MNIQVDPTSSNLASAMLNSKIRPRVVVGYGVKIFHPSPLNYVTRSPGRGFRIAVIVCVALSIVLISNHRVFGEVQGLLKLKNAANSQMALQTSSDIREL